MSDISTQDMHEGNFNKIQEFGKFQQKTCLREISPPKVFVIWVVARIREQFVPGSETVNQVNYV